MRSFTTLKMFPLIAVFLSFILILSDGAALMSLDLGNEFMKIGLIKSGHPMEIALDQESQRKSPTIVSLQDNERFFGTAAENIAAKKPHLSFRFIPSLLGKTLKHPVVTQYQSRFPYHKMSAVNGTISFSLNNESYTVEELVAMLLEYARDTAEDHGDEKIKSAVITIPGYWSQSERAALLKAASIIDLDVLQIMNSNSAVALHFGIFRKKTFNSTAQYYMFYDVGSQDTTATVVSYKAETSSDPELNILGYGYDETFGTSNLIYSLTEQLIKGFIEQHKVNPRENMRSMGKFMKEAKRVLKILSANNEVLAQIENVFDGKDFSMKISRTEFEETNSELFDRLEAPFIKALSEAQLSVDVIQEIVLMGGGTRIPKVQEKILALSKKSDLGKSINTDEAAALGAVYQAAHHSPLFKVLKFDIKDFNNFPISTTFKILDEDSKDPSKLVDKVNLIYKIGNPFPQKRALSVLKHAPNLKIDVFYPDSNMKKLFGTDTLMNIEVPDYEQKIKAHKDKGAIMKGLKVHFYMDMNGILSITGIDAKLETPASSEQEVDGESGTLKSISDKISSFFSNSGNSTDTNNNEADSAKEKEVPLKSSNSTETPQDNQPKKSLKFSEQIEFKVEKLIQTKQSVVNLESSKGKLELFRSNERKRKDLEKVRNDLESFIFACREKLESKEFIEYSTEDERNKISKLAKESYDWYDEQGNDTPAEEFSKHLTQLNDATKAIEFRLKETINRPKNFEKLSKTIGLAKELSKTFNNYRTKTELETFFPAYNFTTDFPMVDIEKRNEIFQNSVKQFLNAFTETEVEAFVKLSDENESWMTESEKSIKSRAKNVDPEITSEQISEKTKELVRQVQSFQEKITNQMRSFAFEFRKLMRTENEEKLKTLKAASKTENEAEAASDTGKADEANSETTKNDEIQKEDKGPEEAKNKDDSTTKNKNNDDIKKDSKEEL